MLYALDLALRYLSRRKLRTFLTTIAIVFGVMVIYGLNAVIPAMERAFAANMMAASGKVDATLSAKSGGTFSADLQQKLSAMDGIAAVNPILSRALDLLPDQIDKDPQIPDRITTLVLQGTDPELSQGMHSFPIQEGRFLQSGDTTSVVISQNLAESGHFVLGGAFPLTTVHGLIDFTIVGIQPNLPAMGGEMVYLPLTEAERALGLEGQLNVLEANYTEAALKDRAAMDAKVLAMAGEGFKLGALTSNGEMLNNLKMGTAIFTFLGMMALLMGGFIIFTTFRTLVTERRRDIGMLRAIGATRGTILRTILIEGLIQGILGTIIGVILGHLIALAGVNGINQLMVSVINLHISPPALNIPLLLLSAILGIGVTVLSSLIPAWSAARITPIDAIRPAMGEVSVRRILSWPFWVGLFFIVIAVVTLQVKDAAVIGITRFFAIVGMILLAPVLVIPLAKLLAGIYTRIAPKSALPELAGENISRLPGRAALTASVTMISLMVLVMVSSIVLSAALGFEKVLRKSLGSDYVLLPPVIALWGTDVGADAKLADSLRQIPGVDTVSGLRYAPGELKGLAVSILGIDPVNYTRVSGLTFVEGKEADAYAQIEQPGKVIVNGIMAGMLNAKPGDIITLDTPTGPKQYQVIAVGNDYLNAKLATAYLSYANLAKDFNRKEDVLLQLSLAPGADAKAVEASIKQAIVQYPQFQLINGNEYINENLRILDAAMIGMYFMLAFLAIPGLLAMLNTLSIGVIERTREIGMMRAVGATRRQVRSVITAEGVILAAIGTLFGLLVGLFMGYNGTQMLIDMGFPMEYTFPWAAVLVTVLVGLGFGWLAAIVPSRQAARLKVVEALRYE